MRIVKVPLELRYIAGWLVFFALNTVAIRYLFIAGTTARIYFPQSEWVQHFSIFPASH